MSRAFSTGQEAEPYVGAGGHPSLLPTLGVATPRDAPGAARGERVASPRRQQQGLVASHSADPQPEREPSHSRRPVRLSTLRGRESSPVTVRDACFLNCLLTDVEIATVARMLEEGSSVNEVRAWLGGALLNAAGGAEVATELGYVVLRTPSHLVHLRGHHECGWDRLMPRLGINRQEWPRRKAGFYIRHYESEAHAVKLWTDQRLKLPIPRNPA